MSHDIYDLSGELGQLLQQRHWQVTTAESCTGGMISAAITDISGSSSWFTQAFITYSNQAKQTLLGVPAELLNDYGAVSEQVVSAMAQGAARVAVAELAIATSGIAGPDGGTPDKPVGTVWLAWSLGGRVSSERCQFTGSRQTVRQQSVVHALQKAIALIKNTV